MGKCEKCGKDCQDGYKYCLDCFQKYKDGQNKGGGSGELSEISEHLKHINWNLGRLVCILSEDEETLKKIDKEENGYM